MMTKKIVRLLVVFCGCIYLACTPEPLAIDIPKLEKQAVVFSQLIPEEVITIALTQTIDALDFSEEEGDTLSEDIVDALLLGGALVTVTYRDVTDTLQEIAQGIYASLTTPQYINETYRLDIITADGRELDATSTMLPQIDFNRVEPIVERSSEDTLVRMIVDFTDLPDDNWYMLNFYTNGEEKNGVDLNSFFSDGSNVLKHTELVSDLLIENENYLDTIDLPNINSTDSLVVTLSNINETYFQFLELRQNATNFFSEVTKEPVTLPTNVNGGLGFFNTHFPDIEYFDLNEY